MADPSVIANRIHSVVLAALKGCGPVGLIKREFKDLEGVDLDVEVRNCGGGSIDALLSSFPDLFVRQANGWRAIVTGEVSNIVKSMGASKNKRGGGQIPRISRGARGGFGSRGRGAPRSYGSAFNRNTGGTFNSSSGFSSTQSFNRSSFDQAPNRFDSGGNNGFARSGTGFSDSGYNSFNGAMNNGRGASQSSWDNDDSRNQPRYNNDNYVPPNNMKPLYNPSSANRGYDDNRRDRDRYENPYGRGSQDGSYSGRNRSPDQYSRQRSYSPDQPNGYSDNSGYRNDNYRKNDDDDRGYRNVRSYDEPRRAYDDYEDRYDDRLRGRNGTSNGDSGYNRFDDRQNGPSRDRNNDGFGSRGLSSYRDEYPSRNTQFDDYNYSSRNQGSSYDTGYSNDRRYEPRTTKKDEDERNSGYGDRRNNDSPTVSNKTSSSTRDDTDRRRREAPKVDERNPDPIDSNSMTKRVEPVIVSQSSQSGVTKKVKNTLSLGCNRIVEVLKAYKGKPLRDYELIKLVDAENTEHHLPVEKYGGPLALLKYCKTKRPDIMKYVVIEEKTSEDGVNKVWLDEESEKSETENKNVEEAKTENIGIMKQIAEMIGDRHEWIVGDAIKHVDVKGVNDYQKSVRLSMAVMTNSLGEFKIDQSETPHRIVRRGWNRRDEIVGNPTRFRAPIVHQYILEEKPLTELKRKIPVRVVKAKYLNDDIFVIVQDDFRQYDKMMEKIQRTASNYVGARLPLDMYQKDDGCLVCTTEDVWYRGIVSGHDKEDELLNVHLVDTGEDKSFREENVLPMPETYSDIATFGLKCRLKSFDPLEITCDLYHEIEATWIGVLKGNGVEIEPATLILGPSAHMQVEFTCPARNNTIRKNVLDELLKDNLIFLK